MSPDAIGTLYWTDRRTGSDRMLRGRIADLARRLPTIRTKAVLRLDGFDDPIGGCESAYGQDDQRIKWNWWCDSDAMPKVVTT